MLEVAPVLRDYGLRVVALDAPGFGASPALAAERYEVDATLTLVERLLDVLGFARVVFMGHSWGGALAVHLAGRSPGRVSELVLLDSGHLDYGDLPYVESERSLEEWIAANQYQIADSPREIYLNFNTSIFSPTAGLDDPCVEIAWPYH